tara:strand:+ start:7731 stop:8855 length:1125 start_codon:yes stop_codon:yes gene_type:complete
MSSVDALKLLQDPSLDAALLKRPSVADSFTALMDSIIARRADAEKLNLEKISTLQEQAKKSARDDKYKNLKTLYDNYDAVVKRDYMKMIAALGNLATACDNIAKGTPSGVILDPKKINKAVLFVAALGPVPIGIPPAPADLLTSQAATLRDAVKVNLDFIKKVTSIVAEVKVYRLERINLKNTTKNAYHPPGTTDPAADEIIRQREELCKLQDKFLENMADNFQSLDMTLMGEIEIELEAGKFNNKEDIKTLFPKISKLMATIGENAAKAMVYERDFFRSRNMTATGVTTQHALKVFKALKSYESKVFGTLHYHPMPNFARLAMQFTAYKSRADAVIGSGDYAANKTIEHNFKILEKMGDSAARKFVMKEELIS